MSQRDSRRDSQSKSQGDDDVDPRDRVDPRDPRASERLAVFEMALEQLGVTRVGILLLDAAPDGAAGADGEGGKGGWRVTFTTREGNSRDATATVLEDALIGCADAIARMIERAAMRAAGQIEDEGNDLERPEGAALDAMSKRSVL